MTIQIAEGVTHMIFDLFNKNGADEYIGEPVSKYEHMVQSAMIAEELNLSEEIIIGALLHDIGHVCVELTNENDMNGFGIKDHDLIGAELLRNYGFSDRVIAVVENHVLAKRYLCAKHKVYFDKLSDASKETLKLQGGPMSDSEMREFESHLFFNEIIEVRKIDELAKDEFVQCVPIEKYRNLIISHLTREN